MASFIRCYEVAQETWLKFLSQNSPIVQLDWPLCGQEWYFTYIYMKSNGNHEKNGSPLDRSAFLEQRPNSPPLTHVSFTLKPPVREKQELIWVGRLGVFPETVIDPMVSHFSHGCHVTSCKYMWSITLDHRVASLRFHVKLGWFCVQLHYGTVLREKFSPSFLRNLVTANEWSHSVPKGIKVLSTYQQPEPDPQPQNGQYQVTI